MSDLTGRTAVVTGAAHGIGRAIAEELAGRGANVAIFDVDQSAAQATAEAITDAGDSCRAMHVDLTDPTAVEQAVYEASGWHQGVDLLVNNAGIMDSLMTPTTVSLDEWNRVMAVNVTATFLTCKYALPGMVERDRGSIVNVASIAALTGGRAGVAYTASKHAVIGLTRNIAWAYADTNVRCNAVCPGSVSTNISSRQLGSVADERGNRRYRATNDIKPPPAQPADIAAVVAFLASDAARSVNGAILPADGGWTAG